MANKIGFALLAVYLILVFLVSINVAIPVILLGVVALVAAIFVLVGLSL